MMQLGCRQARYFGRAKTEFQWIIAAAVANLTLVVGEQRGRKAPNPLGALLHRHLTRIVQAIGHVLLPVRAVLYEQTLAQCGL